MDNKLLENILYKIFKIIIMFYLYVNNKYNTIKNNKYKVTHSCVVSNKGEYIKDITDLVKMYDVCPKTKTEFFKSLIKDTNVVVHVYLERGYEKGEEIEMKYVL
jgi:hypothetical protein